MFRLGAGQHTAIFARRDDNPRHESGEVICRSCWRSCRRRTVDAELVYQVPRLVLVYDEEVGHLKQTEGYGIGRGRVENDKGT